MTNFKLNIQLPLQETKLAIEMPIQKECKGGIQDWSFIKLCEKIRRIY